MNIVDWFDASGRHPRDRVRRWAEYLQEVYAIRDDVSTDDLVDLARPEDSPLHDMVDTWDVEEAAEKHWKQQVASAVGQIGAVDKKGRRFERFFFSVPEHIETEEDKKPRRRWRTGDQVRDDARDRVFIFRSLMSRMRNLHSRVKSFADLAEVSGVLAAAIGSLEDRIGRLEKDGESQL